MRGGSKRAPPYVQIDIKLGDSRVGQIKVHEKDSPLRLAGALEPSGVTPTPVAALVAAPSSTAPALILFSL